MAVFICAADESYDDGNFFYGGFAAPIDDWEGCFANAWNERVLNGPPQIPFLHMTDIRDWNWQKEYGLSPWEADKRIDAAAQVIRSTGSLVPVIFEADRKNYASILRQPFNPGIGRKKAQLEPDYLCFAWFALTQLEWLYAEYKDSVETVDFWVEENDRISHNMAKFHHSLVSAVKYIKRPHFVPLIGEFHEVGKERIPAQAADVLAWHARNAKRGKLDRDGERRYWEMTEGGFGTRRGRFGHRGEMTGDDMRALAKAFAKYPSSLMRPPDAEDDDEQDDAAAV